MSVVNDVYVYYELTKTEFIKMINYDFYDNSSGISKDIEYEFEIVKYKVFDEDYENEGVFNFKKVVGIKNDNTGKLHAYYMFKNYNYILIAETHGYVNESDLSYFQDKEIEDLESNYIKSYKIAFFAEDFTNDIKKIQSIINYVFDTYEKTIEFLYKFFNMANKKSLKKFTNQVDTLSKSKYINNVLPYIENYYITEKLDGKRCVCLVLSDDSIVLISDKVKGSLKKNKDIVHVLDCEVVEKDNIENVYAFDILYSNEEWFINKPFEKRLNVLNNINVKNYRNINFSIKNYIKLHKDTYGSQIQEFYDSIKDNENDGIIFAPNSNVQFKKFFKNKPVKVNMDYYSMITYKWKPIEKMSIDFYIAPMGQKTYMLCNGVSEYDYKRLNLKSHSNYFVFIPWQYHDLKYFPVQFQTPDNLDLYKFKTNEDVGGKIGEFLYINKKWELMRIREDKQRDLALGIYFGNNYNVALDNFKCIMNPLLLEMLTSEDKLMKDVYFKTQSSESSGLRKFNSMVKNNLYNMVCKKIKKKITIVDLSCGKGSDVFKISKLGFKNNIFVDVDPTAIEELNNRILNLKSNNKFKTYNIDLFENVETLTKKIEVKEANVISMNFAIHYFMKDDKSFDNLVKYMASISKKETYIIITFMSGRRVFDALENNTYNNVKYPIVKKYISDKLELNNQLIEIKLPFSNGEFYEEPLVNEDYVRDMFLKYDFTSINKNTFSSFSNDKNNKVDYLDDLDKDFISYYEYMIFKKLL